MLSESTHLFNKPMDLSFSPFLLVTRIYHHILSLMLACIIHLAADDSIAGTTASFCINDNMGTDLLDTIHDQAVYNSKLPANKVSSDIVVQAGNSYGSSATRIVIS